MRHGLLIAAALLWTMAASAQQTPRTSEQEAVRAEQKALAQAQEEAAKVLEETLAEARQETQKAQGQARRDLARFRTRASAEPALLALNMLSMGDMPDVKVNLDLDNAPVKDALKQVFDQAKQEYALDKDVSDDARISIRAKNVKFATALDLITQTAGVRWGREKRDSKTLFRVGKSVRSDNTIAWAGLDTFLKPHLEALPRIGSFYEKEGNIPFISYALATSEERSTFTCPHCKGQTTALRQRQQPKCPKCSRTFQSGWQFCPIDGAKRPPAPGGWKFCPLCGKAVEMEKQE